MRAKASCLTIEIKGSAASGPDCGYAVTFETSLRKDFNDPKKLGAWRDEVTAAVFDAGSAVFGAERSKALKKLFEAFEALNKKYPAFTIKTSGNVPALQIESVDGRRLEIDFSGKASGGLQVTFSRQTLAVPHKINAQGAGGIREAKHGPFPFIGEIKIQPAHKKPPKP